jgi:fucose 4-O-acetylase-like acetyltransferase
MATVESEVVAVALKNEEEPQKESKPIEQSKKKPRIHYIDRLRVLLTFLVVIHHCFWVVENGWDPFHRPWSIDTPTVVISFMILSGDQAYFMGLFFFLAGYVTAPSLKRKGPWNFIKDRFYRLIIPVFLYELVIFSFLFCFTEASCSRPQSG